ncbi:hypothetical protein HKD37_02G005808 [Glycine soja]
MVLLCPSRLETIYGDISISSCRCVSKLVKKSIIDVKVITNNLLNVCTLCGKVLLDLNASLLVMFSNKKTNESSRRKKRERNIKNDAQKKESLNGLIDNVSCVDTFYRIQVKLQIILRKCSSVLPSIL